MRSSQAGRAAWWCASRRREWPDRNPGSGSAATFYAQPLGRLELRDTVDDLDLALAREVYQPTGEPADHAVLPTPQGGQIDLRGVELEPVRRHLLGLGDDAGGVQQRLGGDAADVQTHPAQTLVALDQGDFQPQIGGAEGGGITARTGTDHHQAFAGGLFGGR